MDFDWNPEKNELLKKMRHMSFERIVIAVEEGKIRDILVNPNNDRYKNQKFIIIEIDNYIWVVPAIIEGSNCFFKTAFPSRKYSAIYLKGEKYEE